METFAFYWRIWSSFSIEKEIVKDIPTGYYRENWWLKIVVYVLQIIFIVENIEKKKNNILAVKLRKSDRNEFGKFSWWTSFQAIQGLYLGPFDFNFWWLFLRSYNPF